MRSRQKQSGMTMIGMLIIAAMVGFFVMCIIRMAPMYFEYLSVKNIVDTVIQEHVPGDTTIADTRRRMRALFNTNQIKQLQPADVEVYRKDGELIIDASYEARTSLFWRLDAVLKFDDLKFTVQQ